MKILLAQQSEYIPTHGGANKANRLLLEALSAGGHQCFVVGPAPPEGHPLRDKAFFEVSGVHVSSVCDRAKLLPTLQAEIHRLKPDWVLVSSEDPGQLMLEVALKETPGRVVYIAHTTLVLPFGPGGFVQSEAKTDMLSRCAGIITVSDFMKRYIHDYGGMDSVAFQLPLYGEGPYRKLGRFGTGSVTMINPCAYKGIAIFTGLAEARPQISFAAVPTWGSTDQDRAVLAKLANVTVLQPRESIDDIFEQTKVLLVPSVWHEAFGRVCVEAMLRGIPVLAADMGGLPEAMLGMKHVLPVRPIQKYAAGFDHLGLPQADVPEQDIAPWLQALDRLCCDPVFYQELADLAYQTAGDWLQSLSLAPFLDYLEALKPGVAGRRDVVQPATEGTAETPRVSRLSQLSPARRALLARKLKRVREQ